VILLPTGRALVLVKPKVTVFVLSVPGTWLPAVVNTISVLRVVVPPIANVAGAVPICWSVDVATLYLAAA